MTYKNAIILFSGGLDSTTCVAIAQSQGYHCYGLSFLYGQKHESELRQAKRLGKQLGLIEHRILTLPIGEYGGSSLTDPAIQVENYQESVAIPTSYVPARNTIFLSFAISWGEVIHAYDIFIGANVIDYAGYPDCRPDYIHAFERLANLGTKSGSEGKQFRIHTPLIQLSKAEIIEEGIKLGIDYRQTVSCYRADSAGRACGTCDSCTHRKNGFIQAGIPDQTDYI